MNSTLSKFHDNNFVPVLYLCGSALASVSRHNCALGFFPSASLFLTSFAFRNPPSLQMPPPSRSVRLLASIGPQFHGNLSTRYQKSPSQWEQLLRKFNALGVRTIICVVCSCKNHATDRLETKFSSSPDILYGWLRERASCTGRLRRTLRRGGRIRFRRPRRTTSRACFRSSTTTRPSRIKYIHRLLVRQKIRQTPACPQHKKKLLHNSWLRMRKRLFFDVNSWRDNSKP